jgi:hypothetical protein
MSRITPIPGREDAVDDEVLLRLAKRWQLVRAASGASSNLLGEGDEAALAVSFVAGRQEYWNAFLGIVGFSRRIGFQSPFEVADQLRGPAPTQLLDDLSAYASDTFGVAPNAFVPAARALVSFVPARSLSAAAVLAMSWELCDQLCKGDPICIAQCIRKQRDRVDQDPGE